LAFLRFSRDKRGYEHFYLVEATTNRRGKTRARVLYWFRTPPGVKVGREPFDADVREALEKQNPDVVFDWRKIIETPIPSADVERWRERRRAEKAEKAARRARAADQRTLDEPGVGDSAVAESAIADLSVAEAAGDDLAAAPEQTDAAADEVDEQMIEAEELGLDAAEQQEDALPPVIDTAVPAPVEHRRRRRRRRRGSRGPRGPQNSPGSQGSGGGPAEG